MTPPALAEVAFAGRSNVGKSSLLNKLMGRRNLVRAGATPGTTRQLNLFQIRAADSLEMVLVDLPGYGFAKRGKHEKSQWGALIEGYLRQRVTLRGVVLLVDVRRGLEHEEHELIDFIRATEGRVTRRPLDVILVATKVDKIPSSKRKTEVQAIARNLGHKVWDFRRRQGRGETNSGRPFGTASSPSQVSRPPRRRGVKTRDLPLSSKPWSTFGNGPLWPASLVRDDDVPRGARDPAQALAQTAAPAARRLSSRFLARAPRLHPGMPTGPLP